MSLLNPYKTISRRQSNLYAVAGFALFFGVWSLLTLFFNAQTLPPPWDVFASYGRLFGERALLDQTLISGSRVYASVLCSGLIGIPLGILFGTSPVLESLVARFLVYPLKSAPLIAILPILTQWVGIGELMKVVFLTIGAVVYVIPLTAEAVKAVPKPYYITAEDIGATAWERMRTVLIPIATPQILQSIRVSHAICWTYIVAAELVNSSSGLGYSIARHRRMGEMDSVFAILLIILVLAFVVDTLLALIIKAGYSWYQGKS